jgi:hypothetical protein
MLLLLTGLCALALLFFLPLPSQAQITYVDINPDTVIITGGSYTLDMNNDGVADYQLSVSNDYLYPWDKIVTLPDSCYVSFYRVESCYMAWDHMLNDTIQNADFTTDKPDFYQVAFLGPSYCLHPGWFAGTTDKYIGLKLVKNGHDLFGWLRVDVAADASWMKLKDYAWADSGILAGQVVSGIGGSKTGSQLRICDGPDEITILPKTDLKIIDARIFNGVLQTWCLPVSGDRMTIHKTQFSPGLYVIHLRTSQGPRSVKIIITK